MKWDDEKATKFCEGLKLKFSNYYKYSFTFTAEKNGYTISASIGGTASDIYKEDISADETRNFSSFSAWDFVSIKDSSGKEIFCCSNPWQ